MTSTAATDVVEAIKTAILQWRVAWLDEQKNIAQPPPICRAELKKLKITYYNYKDYESTFVPLLMHEIWAQIYEEWSKIQNELSGTPMDIDDANWSVPIPQNSVIVPRPMPSNSRFNGQTNTSSKQIMIGVVKCESINDFHNQILCQYLVDSNKINAHMKLIGEGDLVRLDLINELNREHQPHVAISENRASGIESSKESPLSLFGYVSAVHSERLTKYTTLSECFTVLPMNRSLHVVTYSVTIAKRPLKLKMTKPMKMSLLYYLKPMIRQVESVANLKESALASDILSPKLITCQISIPTIVSIQSPHYNDMQYKAIVGANEALVRNIPKIQLIQGPPGTGKTHTLIGIIKYFYSEWCDKIKLPKILICAPSNGAIDEVGKRLHKEREFLKCTPANRSLRMVRVGHPDQINPSVRHISLEELVETNAYSKVEERKRKHALKIKQIEAELAECDTEITNLRFLKKHNQIPTIEMKISCLMKDLEAIKASEDIGTKRECSEAAKKSMRHDLIKNADVILTTLNSCQRYPLDVLFKGDRAELFFHCVIVDEASQCCEPELLMPLCYRISKMILIGDPMQLPATVISRHANEYDFGRSLFERFFIHFGNYDQKSPIAMLTEQYRMHPQICSFPSKQFYDNRLISAPKTSAIHFPLKPYIMFDLKHSSEKRSDKSSIENEVEASFVRNLLTAVLNKAPENSSVGVITPYKGQRRLITNKIQTLQTQRNITVDVNTCDGFQGQERDIIILSCVRAFESYGSVGFLKSVQRINVALTRAKHSMIICVSAKSLSNDKTWQNLVEDARARDCVQILNKTPSTEAIGNMINNHVNGRLSSISVAKAETRLNTTNGGVTKKYLTELYIPMDID